MATRRKPPTMRAQATEAALRKQAARDTLEALLAERAAKRVQALESRIDPADPNNARRRTAQVEIKTEDQRLSHRERLRGANVGRELHRHNSRMRIFETQTAVNVVGTGSKVTLHWTNKEQAQLAADWFNQVWAADCDARDDNHLADFCELALATVGREGECLCLFDDFSLNDGRLTWYEADQLPSVNDKLWQEWARAPEQGNLFVELDVSGAPLIGADGRTVPLQILPGRLVNRRGRVAYYIADEQHGRFDVDPADKDLRYLSRNVARLLKSPWRLNQHIGQPEILALAGDLEDLDAMRSAEIASARKTSERSYVVKGRDAYEQELARVGINADDEVENAETDPAAGATPTTRNLSRLERYADGYVDYIGTDEEVVELGVNRPNMNAANFHGEVGGQAGAALGLARVYSTLQASTSYTAFRGEMLLTWGTFARRQKWMERRLLDWLAIKAIGWGVARGYLKVTLPADWIYTLAWTFPTMPEVDEERTVAAEARRLKNGLTDYARLLGPNWLAKFQALADQLTVIRKTLPELEILETKAGAPSVGAATDAKDNADAEPPESGV